MRCRFKRIEDFDRFHLVRKRSKEERYRIFVAPIPEQRTNFHAQSGLFEYFSFQRLRE